MTSISQSCFNLFQALDFLRAREEFWNQLQLGATKQVDPMNKAKNKKISKSI